MSGTEAPLTSGQWIARLGMLAGAESIPESRRKETLAAMADALRTDFAPSVFTVDSAKHVARHANAKGFFPTLAQVSKALAEWARQNPTRSGAGRLTGPPGTASSESGLPGHWERFVARRLAEGGNREHLRSLLRSQVSGPELGRIMGRLFPETEAPRGHAERSQDYDPAWVEQRVAKLVGDPPDRWRAIHARTLLRMLLAHRPDLAARYGEELGRLADHTGASAAEALVQAWAPPRVPRSSAAPAEAAPAPAPPERGRMHALQLLRALDAEVAAGRGGEAAARRAADLRGRLAAEAEAIAAALARDTREPARAGP